MFDLTEEQHNEIATAGEQPVTAIDRQTETVYVLVRQEEYERIRNVFPDDDARSWNVALANLHPEDWEDAANYEDAP